MNYDTVDPYAHICTFDSHCECHDCVRFYRHQDEVMRKHAPTTPPDPHEHQMDLVKRTDEYSIWRCSCGHLTEEGPDAYMDYEAEIIDLLELRDELGGD